ncbi:MAG TPA: flagellar hook-basal body complex protein FliE [Gammaproteobacteria bacterium]
MSDLQIQRVLAEMRALSARAAELAKPQDAAPAQGTAPARFSALLEQSLAEVNAAQQEAARLATRFEQGAPDVTLAEVMVSMQKASLQFEAVTQVRNRLVAAYQEIMNMQV